MFEQSRRTQRTEAKRRGKQGQEQHDRHDPRHGTRPPPFVEQAAIGGGGDAPALMTGTGQDNVHLLVVCTAERGLCGAFNSSIARLARDKALALKAEGKTVKIICVGKKVVDHLRRQEGLRPSEAS
eukprot:gene51864-biopygen36677